MKNKEIFLIILSVIILILIFLFFGCNMTGNDENDNDDSSESSSASISSGSSSISSISSTSSVISSTSSNSSLRVNKISTGHFHTSVILNDGTVKCWGRNDYGDLGYGDTIDRGSEVNQMGSYLPVVDLGTGRSAIQTANGYHHTVALLDNGMVKCWGAGSWGELGYGDMNSRGDEAGEMGDNLPYVDLGTGRTAIQVAAGTSMTVVLLDNGMVKCWGANSFGQLGYGDTENRGDEAGEMGEDLPYVNLGTGRTAVKIECKNEFVIVLLDNGTVKCWGRNHLGQLGYGDTESRGDEPDEMGIFLPTVDLGTGRTVMDISAGSGHVIAILDNNTVKCWGNNSNGVLGYGDSDNRGDNAGEMGDFLHVVELGTGRTALKVAAGSIHSAVLLDDGTVKCWGFGTSGELGYEDMIIRGDNTGEMGDSLPTVNLGAGIIPVHIAIGRFYSTALFDNGRIKCWGSYSNGKLGYEDKINRGDNAGEMGDNLPFVNLW